MEVKTSRSRWPSINTASAGTLSTDAPLGAAASQKHSSQAMLPISVCETALSWSPACAGKERRTCGARKSAMTSGARIGVQSIGV